MASIQPDARFNFRCKKVDSPDAKAQIVWPLSHQPELFFKEGQSALEKRPAAKCDADQMSDGQSLLCSEAIELRPPPFAPNFHARDRARLFAIERKAELVSH